MDGISPPGHGLPGFYIAFEGPEGAGKTIQTKLLREFLREHTDRDIVFTREPGGTKISEQVRAILHDVGNSEFHPIAEAYGYALARAQLLREVVEPSLCQGKIVLSDRTFLTSIAYQGYGQKVGMDLVWEINKIAVSNLIPDLAVYLRVVPEVGLQRKRRGDASEINIWELRDIELHRRCIEGYDILAKSSLFADRFITIDAEQSIETVAELVQEGVLGLLNERRLRDEAGGEIDHFHRRGVERC